MPNRERPDSATKKQTAIRLGDDIRGSLHEALDHAGGKRTKAIVYKVIPRIRAAKTEPKAVRRALAKSSAAH